MDQAVALFVNQEAANPSYFSFPQAEEEKKYSEEARVEVLAVFHTSRDPQVW